MTRIQLLQKIDGYKYAVSHNDMEWANDILSFLESENYHKLIPLLQNNQFEDARLLADSYFK